MVAQSRAAQARVNRLHRVAGIGAVVTAAVAALGVALPVLSLPENIPEPSMLSSRVVLLAAAVLLVAGLGLFAPGRAAETRPTNDLEYRQTMVLALDISEASVKVRTGPPIDDDADLESDVWADVWAGVLPLTVVSGEPIADVYTSETLAPPASVTPAPVDPTQRMRSKPSSTSLLQKCRSTPRSCGVAT